MDTTAVLDDRQSLATRRRLDALVEIIAGYAVLCVVSWSFTFDQFAWPDAQLHPFFLVTLFIAARYGTADGAIAGVIGAGILIAAKAMAHPQAFGSAGALLDLELMTVPYLLIVLGTIIGEIRQVAEDEIIGLLERLRMLKRDVDVLSTETRVVREYNEDLQERIASSTGTTGAFYEAAASVQRLNEEEALPAILEMVQRFVGAEKSAVYIRGVDGWEMRHDRGLARPDEFPRHFSLGQPVLSKVAEGEVVTVLDVPDATGSDVVMAAPLFAEDQNGQRRVHAAIAVLALPLSSLNAGTVRNLTGISEWGSQVIGSAQRFERVRERDPADEQTGTYRYGYAVRRLEEELGRWRRYNMPTSLLVVKIVNLDRVPRGKQPVFLRRVARMLLRNLRAVDLVTRWKTPDTFALVLPATRGDGSRILASRLLAQFQQDVLQDVPKAAELSLRFGVGTTGDHGDSREELTLAAERFEFNG